MRDHLQGITSYHDKFGMLALLLKLAKHIFPGALLRKKTAALGIGFFSSLTGGHDVTHRRSHGTR